MSDELKYIQNEIRCATIDTPITKAPIVVIAQDDGKDARNMFGQKLNRFYYHCASVSNNTSYSPRTNCLIDEEDNAYQYKLVRVKKIKRLGKR